MLARLRLARGTQRAAKQIDDDAAELNPADLSLDLPYQLINKSFKTLTKIAQTASQLIMNSARRYSRFMLFFKPVFGDALIIKGYEDPTTTTTTSATTTTTATTTESPKLNEV